MKEVLKEAIAWLAVIVAVLGAVVLMMSMGGV